MTNYSPESYRETQILTATPQRLRLMLIEGALRYAREAMAAAETRDFERAFESTVKCREIVLEVIHGIDQKASDLGRQVAAIYAFMYRTLSLANLYRDWTQVSGVLRVLEEERVTWQAVCEKLPEAPEGWQRARSGGLVFDDHQHAILAPNIDPYSSRPITASQDNYRGQLSLDA